MHKFEEFTIGTVVEYKGILGQVCKKELLSFAVKFKSNLKELQVDHAKFKLNDDTNVCKYSLLKIIKSKKDIKLESGMLNIESLNDLSLLFEQNNFIIKEYPITIFATKDINNIKYSICCSITYNEFSYTISDYTEPQSPKRIIYYKAKSIQELLEFIINVPTYGINLEPVKKELLIDKFKKVDPYYQNTKSGYTLCNIKGYGIHINDRDELNLAPYGLYKSVTLDSLDEHITQITKIRDIIKEVSNA